MRQIPIPDILAVCSAVCGTDSKRASDPSLNTARLMKARQLFLVCAKYYGKRIDHCARAIRIDVPDARALLSDGSRKLSSSTPFKEMYAQAIAHFRPTMPAPAPLPRKEGKGARRVPVFTEDDERRMREACLSAMKFMQTYGLPSDDGTVRRAVRDGYGYYPTPTTLPD